jgi:hypothetical protein
MSTPENNNKHDNPFGFSEQDQIAADLHINAESAPGSKAAGYEMSDANINGILAFVAVLAASVGVFFVVCFAFGKLINHELIVRDGEPTRWNTIETGSLPSKEREDIVSNPVMQQRQWELLTKKFPSPRVQLDDGNQDTADMHAREDLLLDNYSYIDQGAGTVRIPIDRAMALIAQRGLPVAPRHQSPIEPQGEQGQAAQNPTAGHPLAGADPVKLTAPLTDGFARTGYEQQVDEERHQRLESREAMQEHEQQQKQGAAK